MMKTFIADNCNDSTWNLPDDGTSGWLRQLDLEVWFVSRSLATFAITNKRQ